MPIGLENIDGLSANEYRVMGRLIYIEDYRTYKGEIEDGWFIKSKSELSKECGFENRDRLYRTLDKLLEKGLIEMEAINGYPTKFRINYSQINNLSQK